ncbi:MAG: hypothetical protein MR984_08060 [Bacteroidales bacterium]|nr:hypothetical protein [Bacteroidales bacterium]
MKKRTNPMCVSGSTAKNGRNYAIQEIHVMNILIVDNFLHSDSHIADHDKGFRANGTYRKLN